MTSPSKNLSNLPMVSLMIRPDAAIAANLGKLEISEFYADVTIHCKGQVKVKTSKLILVQFSPLFKAIFQSGCHCSCSTGITYDLICPDFEPGPLEQVLNLIYRGQTFVSSEEEYKSLKIILNDFQIGPDLTDLIKNRSFTNQTKQAGLSNPTCLPIQIGLTKLNAPVKFTQTESRNAGPKMFPCEPTIARAKTISILRRSGESKTETQEDLEDSIKIMPPNSISDQTSPVPADIIDIKEELHSEESQPDDECLLCGLCGKQFTQLSTLEEHQPNCQEQISHKEEEICFEISSIAEEDDDMIESTSNSSNVQTASAEASVSSKLANLSYEQLMEPIQNGTEFICRICSSTFSTKRSLCLHYSCIHYKEAIMKLNENNLQKCISCNASFHRLQSLINHIGSAHHVLEKLVANDDPKQVFFSRGIEVKSGKIPGTDEIGIGDDLTIPEDNVSSGESSSSSNVESLVAPPSVNQTSTTNLSYTVLVSPTNTNGKFEFNCKICSLYFLSKANLCLHYSYVHYKEEIIKLNQYNTKKCVSCNETFLSVQSLVHHIGSGHRVLEKIVNNEDHQRVFWNPPIHLKPLYGRKRSYESNFTTATQLEMRAKVPLVTFKCNICDRRFVDPEVKMNHLATCHFQDELKKFFDQKTNRCQLCQNVVASQKLQLEHLARCYEDFDQSLIK